MSRLIPRPLVNWLLLSLVIGLGVALRLWLVIHYPLWLDEQYSLYFAWQDTPWQLLVAGRDSHPGLFYWLLQLATSVTDNLVILRLALGVAPQLVGTAVVLGWIWYRRRSFPLLLLLAAGLWLNPFFIYLSFQLRMYSIAYLAACLLLVAFSEWRRHDGPRQAGLVLFALLLGNMTIYAFNFLTLGVIGYFCYRAWLQRSRPVLGLSLLALTIGQFFVQNGWGIKAKFEFASSWIPLPNLTNTAQLFWTVTGFSQNYMSAAGDFSRSDAAFYFLFLLLMWWVWRQRQHWREGLAQLQQRDWFWLVVLPVGLILVSSFAMTLLSQRFFFYQFVPKLSLFLPRAFTPIVVFATYFLSSAVWRRCSLSRSARLLGLLGVLVFALGWGKSWLTITELQGQAVTQHRQQQELLLISRSLASSERVSYYLPSWQVLTQLSAMQRAALPEIDRQLNRSEELFQELHQPGALACSLLAASTVTFTQADMATSAVRYYLQVLPEVDHCCQQVWEQWGQIVWQCP